MLVFVFPHDINDDDADDKAFTINQFCNLKWKDVTMDCGRWNSIIGSAQVIGSVSEKLRVSGLNSQKTLEQKFSLILFSKYYVCT
jgi:hypothetical protein